MKTVEQLEAEIVRLREHNSLLTQSLSYEQERREQVSEFAERLRALLKQHGYVFEGGIIK
jgi:FtsZ-binding cell division protein ZapB